MVTSSSELRTLIEYFEKRDQYRYWTEEVVEAIKRFTPEREDLIKFFDDKNMYLWYSDEILAKLNDKA